MSTVVIEVEGLGKRNRRGERQQYSSLRDVLTRTLRAPWKVFQLTPEETFWALRDVDLEVRQGEVPGLIGRNGAGKTTPRKILSRITKPMTGWAGIDGRVGSLLEVGAGFHPELTGRENTFRSGAILGMSKSEIKRKFEEIVAFAELEQFIDTPVKHYSSGMYVRLAFAVAAHLEADILFVKVGECSNRIALLTTANTTRENREMDRGRKRTDEVKQATGSSKAHQPRIPRSPRFDSQDGAETAPIGDPGESLHTAPAGRF